MHTGYMKEAGLALPSSWRRKIERSARRPAAECAGHPLSPAAYIFNEGLQIYISATISAFTTGRPFYELRRCRRCDDSLRLQRLLRASPFSFSQARLVTKHEASRDTRAASRTPPGCFIFRAIDAAANAAGIIWRKYEKDVGALTRWLAESISAEPICVSDEDDALAF